MSKNKWKDFLLKSGIPLEYEISQLLDEKGCMTDYEYTYLRADEHKIINEFSYDLYSSYIKGDHFFDLMIECKFRDESTNWLFIPGSFGGRSEFEHLAFLHPNDHFTENLKFQQWLNVLPPIAPAVMKGIEINSSGQDPKTIKQAVCQLSYAMAEKIVDGMMHQIEKLLVTSNVIFYNIPVIVTTANLYRLNDNITISNIKNEDKLENIATKEDSLILQITPSKHLEKYNNQIFTEFINSYGESTLNKTLNSFNEDINFVCSCISHHYAPQAILIIQHSALSKGFDKLFDLLNEIVKPGNNTIELYKKDKERREKISLEFEKKINEIKTKNNK